MKQLLFIAAMLISTGLFAQNRLIRATDTIANTSLHYNTTKALGGYDVIGLQWTGTKVTGTVAGYAWGEATIDGTNWKVVTDSLTIGNVSTAQSKIWQLTDKAYFKTRVAVVLSAGTIVQDGWYITK